jgi:metal-dependent amidase/aminoacylase/carboxypeptidase family protein
MGGEDFSAYLQRIPGAMFRLGVRAEGAAAPSLHSPLFDIDERAMPLGAKILAQAAILAADPARKGLRSDEDLVSVEPVAHTRR